MAEVQVQGWGTSAAPNDRTTKDSERLEVVALEATFDGSAAAGSFVPAVQIISDSGAEVGTFPLAETLLVGDSATVTFAPFLGRTSAATGLQSVTWARYNGTNSVNPLPLSKNLDWSLAVGTALLDLTFPGSPAVLFTGTYLLSVSVDCVGITAGSFFRVKVGGGLYQRGNASTGIVVGGLAGGNFVNVAVAMTATAGDFLTCVVWHNEAAAENYHHATDILYIA